MKNAQKPSLLSSKIIVACVTLVCSYAQLSAQSSTGSIEGVTVDSSGAVIPAAEVSVLCDCNECPNRPCSECCPSARSDEEGRFKLKNVAPGVYTLKGKATGFKDIEVHGVRVTAHSTQTVTLTFDKPTAKADEAASASKTELDKKVHLLLEVINSETKEPLKNAKITLHRECDCRVECPTKPCAECCPSEDVKFAAITDDVGAVQFKGEPGIYRIDTEYRAYSKESLIQVAAGETEKVKIRLAMVTPTDRKP